MVSGKIQTKGNIEADSRKDNLQQRNIAVIIQQKIKYYCYLVKTLF